jgi:predicted aldo/keto reductase-like oxidoreductase
MPTRPLGKIGFQAGILGLGAQRVGEDRANQAVVDRLVGEAIDNGLNYIDTAPNYGRSEERLGHALKGKRDKIFLVTKIETRSRAEALNQVRESLRRLQTDHLDCVLFHNIGREDRFPDIDAVLSADGSFAGLREAKKQGMIRHIGFSSHTNTPRLLHVFETGEIDLFMGVLNFVEKHTYYTETKVLPEARRKNIGIIAMKVFGGPERRSTTPRLSSEEDRHTSLRYVWGIPGLAVAIIGLRTPEELRQALAQARTYRPFEPAELRAIEERGKQLAAQWGPIRGPVA